MKTRNLFHYSFRRKYCLFRLLETEDHFGAHFGDYFGDQFGDCFGDLEVVLHSTDAIPNHGRMPDLAGFEAHAVAAAAAGAAADKRHQLTK